MSKYMPKKKNAKWRDPSLSWRDPSLHSTKAPGLDTNASRVVAGNQRAPSAQSFSSGSTIPGPSKPQHRTYHTGRARIKDKSFFRGSSNPNFPNDRADAPHAPWDDIPNEPAESEIEPPRVSILTRNNLRAHEIAANKNSISSHVEEAISQCSVSDLIELDGCEYDLPVRISAEHKNSEDALFEADQEDLTTGDPFNLGETPNYAISQGDLPPEVYNNSASAYLHDQALAEQPFFESAVYEVPNTSDPDSENQKRDNSSNDEGVDIKLEPASETSTQSLNQAKEKLAVEHIIGSDGSTYSQYNQGNVDSDEFTRQTADPLPSYRPSVETIVTEKVYPPKPKLNPEVPSFSLVRTPQNANDIMKIQTPVLDFKCPNETFAKRPRIGFVMSTAGME
jgi:hypothetical protein